MVRSTVVPSIRHLDVSKVLTRSIAVLGNGFFKPMIEKKGDSGSPHANARQDSWGSFQGLSAYNWS